jgi:hypothetical protein
LGFEFLGVQALVARSKFDGWMDTHDCSSQRPINNPRVFNEMIENTRLKILEAKSSISGVGLDFDFVMLGDGMIPYFIDGAA